MLKFKNRYSSWPLFKYFFREIFFTFVIGTLVFLSIVVSFQALRLVDFVLTRGVPLSSVFQLVLHSYHSVLTIAVPIAFLFAVLWGTSRAHLDGEIVGMQVNGISLSQVFFPIFCFSVLLALMCAYAANYSVPRGNRKFESMVTRLGVRTVIRNLKPKVFQEGFFGMVLYADEISDVNDEMKRVFIYDERDSAYPYAITAQSATIRKVESLGLITLRLADGSIHIDKKSAKEQQQKIDFDIYDINLNFETGDDAVKYYRLPSLDYDVLVKALHDVKKPSQAYTHYLVEYHRRFSMAFSCIVFGALGFFLSIISRRSMGSSSVVFCMMVGVCYWLFYVLANAAAVQGWAAPVLAVWAPNVIFGLIPIFLYRRHLRP